MNRGLRNRKGGNESLQHTFLKDNLRELSTPNVSNKKGYLKAVNTENLKEKLFKRAEKA